MAQVQGNTVILGAGADLEEVYEIGSKLGDGTYGVVREVVDKKTRQVYACKTIAKPREQTSVEEKQAFKDRVRREVDILRLVSPHATVAEFRKVYEDERQVHIVMELCGGGELLHHIVENDNFSERDAARYFKRMVEMVAHLHALGVMHRDIKLETFLLKDETDHSDLKACNFSLATFHKPGQRFSETVGTSYYMAPEVLRGDYGLQRDTWSLGVVLHILLCGRAPFWGMNNEQVYESIRHGRLDFEAEPWDTITDAAKDLVRSILEPNEQERATLQDILTHPWVCDPNVAPDAPLNNVVITRLQNYAGMHRLRKAAIQAVAKQLSLVQIKGLWELFKSYDANHDGQITLDELHTGLARHSQVAEVDVEQILQGMDVDGNGVIDYQEFVSSTVNLNAHEMEEVCQKAFRDLDKDGNKQLDLNEVAMALFKKGGWSEEEMKEVEKLVEHCDDDGDRLINYSEFLKVLHGHSDLRLLRATQSLERHRAAAAAIAAVNAA